MNVSFRRWSRAAAVAAAGVPLAVYAQQTRRPVARPEVTGLTVKGVESVDEHELLASLAIQRSRCKSIALTPLCWISKSPLFYERAYLNHEELARDVIRARVFYYLRGWRDAAVDTIVRPNGRRAVKVTLVVHEGPPTLVSAVAVNQTTPALGRKDVDRRVVLEPGRPLNVFELDSSRVRLRDELWERGYADAVVDTATTVDSAAHTAAVRIDVNPRWVARVADLTVEGNKDVSAHTIRRALSFGPGDVYRRSNVLSSQRTLYESNLFRRAQVALQWQLRRDSIDRTDGGLPLPPRQLFPRLRDSAGGAAERRQRLDSLKHVVVVVTEAPPRAARVSFGFNTIDFAQIEGRYTNYNWGGGARQLSLLATFGNLFARSLNGSGIFYDVSEKTVVGASQDKYFQPTYNVSADVRQPWFKSPRNEVAVGAFTHRRIAPGIYVDRGYGGTATFTRTLTERGPASLNYRFEVTSVDAGNVYFCIAYGVCDQATLNALHRNQRLSPLASTSSLDKTDSPYEPRRGYRAQLDLEHASSLTASDFRYNRGAGEMAMFLPIGKRSAIGGRIRAGAVKAIASTAEAVGAGGTADGDGLLHPRKRFYAGGARSVRGYQENQLGPRVLTIAPDQLRGDATLPSGDRCLPTTPIENCNPNVPHLKDRDFDARPLGGNELAEASVEFRFPVLGGVFDNNLLGALFVDAGWLSQNSNPEIVKSRAAVTPGFGVRYLSPVGPIRVDLGINPMTRENVTVVTEDGAAGARTLVTLKQQRLYSPVGGGLLSRLTLHLAIGEAF